MSNLTATLQLHADGRAELVLLAAELTPDACEAARGHAEALAQTGAGESAARVVILRGGAAAEGGAPGAPWPRPPAERGPAALEPIQRLVEAVAALPMPVVALLGGEVAAEGLELALAADLRLAAGDARFTLPHLAQGRLPACGGSQRLPRLVGLSAAFELFFGPGWSAERALELGLINGAVPPGRLAEEGERWARALVERGPLAARFLKEVVRRGMEVPLEQALLIEEDAYLLLQTTEDRKAGIRAFLEKRKPIFEGR